MKTKLFLTAAVLFAVPTLALAGLGGRSDARGPAQFDADGDGIITLEEVMAVRGDRFAVFDADGDGVLSQAEMEAGRTAMMGERVSARIADLDGDGDGALTEDEFLAEAGRRAAERFAALDADDDGVVTADEMVLAHGRAFRRRSRRHGARRPRVRPDGRGRRRCGNARGV